MRCPPAQGQDLNATPNIMRNKKPWIIASIIAAVAIAIIAIALAVALPTEGMKKQDFAEKCIASVRDDVGQQNASVDPGEVGILEEGQYAMEGRVKTVFSGSRLWVCFGNDESGEITVSATVLNIG